MPFLDARLGRYRSPSCMSQTSDDLSSRKMAESGNSNRGVALDGELFLLARFHHREISREPASGASVLCGQTCTSWVVTAVSGSWKVHDTGTRLVSPEKVAVAPASERAGSPPREGLALPALLGSPPFRRRLGCLRLRLIEAPPSSDTATADTYRDGRAVADRQISRL